MAPVLGTNLVCHDLSRLQVKGANVIRRLVFLD